MGGNGHRGIGDRVPLGGLRQAVAAFGGVVVRGGPAGPTVAVVHRPRYGDWSLPKGKPKRAEGPAATARREVEEETGLECQIGEALGEVRYALPDGRPKVVGYFLMRPGRARPRPPDDEVDAVEWWPVDLAVRQLSHEGERRLLAAVAALLVDGTADDGAPV